MNDHLRATAQRALLAAGLDGVTGCDARTFVRLLFGGDCLRRVPARLLLGRRGCAYRCAGRWTIEIADDLHGDLFACAVAHEVAEVLLAGEPQTASTEHDCDVLALYLLQTLVGARAA